MSKVMRAYVSVQPAKNVAGLADYLEYGRGSMKTEHKENGTDRMAAMYCDAPSPAAFVAEAKRLAKANSRKNEAYSLIVSHPEGRYDPTAPDSLQEMVRNDVEGARRAYPHSKLFAVAHIDGTGTDGCGGKPHTHIVAMNHDVETGKAITANRTAVKVREIFNELGEELGWEPTEVTYDKTLSKSKAHGREKQAEVDTSADDAALAATRQRLASMGEFELNLFDDVLKAKEAARGKDGPSWVASFESKLKDDGIELEFIRGRRRPHQKKSDLFNGTQGIIYRRINPETKRVRGMKASDLGDQVKFKSLAVAVLRSQKELARKAAEAEAQRPESTTAAPGSPEPMMTTSKKSKKTTRPKPTQKKTAQRPVQKVAETPQWIKEAREWFDWDEEGVAAERRTHHPATGQIYIDRAQYKLDQIAAIRAKFEDQLQKNTDEARKIAEDYLKDRGYFYDLDKDIEWIDERKRQARKQKKNLQKAQTQQTVEQAHVHVVEENAVKDDVKKAPTPQTPSPEPEYVSRMQDWRDHYQNQAEKRAAEAEAERKKPS